MKALPQISSHPSTGGFPLIRLAASVLLASLALSAPSAFAQVTTGLRASLIIQEEGGTATTLSLENLFTFNQASGQHQLVAPGHNLAGTGWQWVNETYTTPGTTDTQTATSLRLVNTNQATVTLMNAVAKVDPFMTYSLSVKNNTAVTQTYTFVFGETMIPAFTGDYTLFADVAMSISTATPPATIAPVGAKIQQVALSGDGGLTNFNGGVDVGNSLTRLTNGTGTAYDLSPLITASTGLVLDWWEFQTSFTLTPGGDAVGLSGYAEITPIPEPSAFALLASGTTLGLVALRRRRLGRQAAVAA